VTSGSGLFIRLNVILASVHLLLGLLYFYTLKLESNVWNDRRFCRQNWLPRQRPSSDRKTNFRSFIYSHSSTIPTDWVKIGRVDVQIKDLAESLKHEHVIRLISFRVIVYVTVRVSCHSGVSATSFNDVIDLLF